MSVLVLIAYEGMELSPTHTPDAVVNVVNSTPSVPIEECGSISFKSPSSFVAAVSSPTTKSASLWSIPWLHLKPQSPDFILPC